jgi:hypothetical protein
MFGYSDAGSESYKERWKEYRAYWLEEVEEKGFKWLGKEEEYEEHIKTRRKEKLEQLKNIGVGVGH